MNIVEISVSEGDSSIKLFNIIGNLLFPFLAIVGLGGLNGSMDFGRSKSKFQEILEIGSGLCPVKVFTGYVGLRTCVHSWTRVRILPCPVKIFTGHKPFP